MEAQAALPSGAEERFNGYGIMGLPFRSGHVLAMRRFAAFSVGPGYTSIWHRAISGAWSFYADVAPRLSCTRYFGAVVNRAILTPITIAWTGPDRFTIAAIAERLEWEVRLGTTPATRFMNAVGRLMPDAAWRSPALLGAMEPLAGALLGVGRVGLHGRVPNGQRFVANPLTMWAIGESRAVLAGEDLGAPGPVEPQACLGDFWVPQRGIFALGRAFFEPFDAERHSSRITSEDALAGGRVPRCS